VADPAPPEIIVSTEPAEIIVTEGAPDVASVEGTLADATDLHPQAVGFEAQMDMGLARQAYWPDAEGTGFHWVVESRTKNGMEPVRGPS
jgi:hypothetical protein